MTLNTSSVIKQIESQIKELNFGMSPTELYEPLQYLMQLGGKRIRPYLTILGYYAFRDDWMNALTPAIAVEVFHNFTLMHDDIMDQATLRRGKSTVHEKWNTNTAILSGDVMLIKAYELFAQVDPQYLSKVLHLFNACATEVCEGQQKDMNFERLQYISETQYLDMIRQKTSVLLGFALELGAVLAGASLVQQEMMRDVGINLGIGFQIQDDLLDVYGNAQQFGKQVGGDIICNKKTLLWIYAFDRATGETHDKLNYWLSVQDFDYHHKVREITDIYDKLDIRKLAENQMNHYFEKSFKALDKLSLRDSKKDILRQYAKQIIHRKK